MTVSSTAPNVFEEGELLYIQNIQVKEYKNKKFLWGARNRKILKGINSKIDEKLKKYFLKHKNINEYFDLIIFNNKNNNINDIIEKSKFQDLLEHNFVFIKDIITIFNKANDIQDKINNEFRLKISGRVIEINHSQKNHYCQFTKCQKK